MLKQSDVIVGSAYLQTGPIAWEQGNEADSWQVHPAALRQLELPRLTHCDCEQWLSELGHEDRELVDLLYEETEGVPARIEALLAQEDFLNILSNSRVFSQTEPLSQFSAKQRRWLHAAAMQAKCSRETLQMLIGKVEIQDAIDWFDQELQLWDRVHKTAKSVEDWSIRLKPALREEVLQQAKDVSPYVMKVMWIKLSCCDSCISKFHHVTTVIFSAAYHLSNLFPIRYSTRSLVAEE